MSSPAMSAARPPWLDPIAPWDAPDATPAAALNAVGPTLTAGALTQLRGGRYVPIFGLGAEVTEAERALRVLRASFSADADPRAMEHAAVMLEHPALGAKPYEFLAAAIQSGEAEAWAAPLALGATLLLGADDGLRARVADALLPVSRMRPHCELSSAAGGGSEGAWREHYQRVCLVARRNPDSDRTVTRAMRAWYEWVLARRWSALDQLRSTRESLPALGRWLVDSARWAAGDDGARESLTQTTEALLAPVNEEFPRLTAVVAKDLAEILARPWTTRWAILRCAASRDHASIAIRHWLHAATETAPEPEDTPERSLESLGPEPTRAGRAAAESRHRAEDFILDWFVPDRAAGRLMDAWAAATLRTWHRLHGAAMLGRALEARRGGDPREVLP